MAMATPDGDPAADPHAIARAIERARCPWWVCWFGDYTGRFWAVNAWHASAAAWVSAPTPEELITKIDHFETWHPGPDRTSQS